MAAVLRLKPGDRVIAFDGRGLEWVVELDSVARSGVGAHILETRRGVGPAVHLTLLQGVPKGAKMDDIVRMGTELGVREFTPFTSARTVATGRGRVERWRRIATEAAKQSRRSEVPVVGEPVPLRDALVAVAEHHLVVMLWEEERSRSIADALRSAGDVGAVAVVVGPEGGFTQQEVKDATAAGAVPVTVGPLILRTETAGIVALAMVVYELTVRRAGNQGSGPPGVR